MASSLVIVESPAKARTINRYLGKGLRGQIQRRSRARPAGGREGARTAANGRGKPRRPASCLPRRRPSTSAAAPAHSSCAGWAWTRITTWEAEYEVLPGKEKVVAELKRLADRSEHVYLATDLDREGEAIAWHLQQLIGGDADRFRRVVFNEITRPAIEAAFKNPSRVQREPRQRAAGAALSRPRRRLRVVAAAVVQGRAGLSAGRVQSVAVRLLVEREREIRAFVPEEYWEGFADLQREEERAGPPLRRGSGRRCAIPSRHRRGRERSARPPARS